MLEKIITYFAKRHILVNLILIITLVGGVLTWSNTSKEEMPDVTFDRVRISVNYRGAPAEDVEYFVPSPLKRPCGAWMVCTGLPAPQALASQM